MASAPSRSTFDPMASAIKPVIEQLEGRMLLSVSLADDGTLTLDGTAAGDEVTVKLGEKKQLEVSFNGEVHYFARRDVRRIVFDGGAGDDSFRYMNYGGKGDARVFARGGDGDDIIATGHADDAVYGGAGDDLLSGGSGDNKISGGEGNDTLVARDGNDRLLGGAGEDQVAAGRGKKLVRSGAGADLTGSLQPQFPITTFTPDPAGYSPEMQRYAYGLGSLDDPNYTNRGQGQAIAIVGAFDLPNIHEDMDAFTRQYELPGMNRKQLRVINLAPKKRRLVAEDWYGEAMLDAQWAHAIAPKARIYMVQAATNAFADINAAVERAKRILNNGFGGGVISMSLGSDNDQEFERVLNTSFRGPDTRYISFVVSAGDTGGTNSSPSTSPNVVSVGGTALYLNQFGSRVAGDEPVAVDPETGLDVWGEHHVCDDETGLGITDAVGTRNVFPGGEVAWHSGGGGPSNIWDRPAYQENRNLPGHPFFDPLGEQRATPDIAWNGDPATGVGVYNTVGNGGQSGFGTVGGTSAGAPQFAGLVALVNQLRAENGKRPVGSTLIDRIYRLGGRGIDQYFYDVGAPFGPDVYHGSGPIVSPDDELCNDIFISPALPGWDFATGWGSPNGSSLIPALAEERIPLTSGRLRISGTFTGETTAGVPEWIGFNGTTRAAGYGTVGVSAMTTTRVYRSTQAGGGGGVGTVDNSVFVIDFFGDDAQDGWAQRNVWTPVVDANGAVTSLTIDQGSGDIVTLYKHGKSVQGLAYVTITELPAADPGGGGGGGGGQPPAGIVRTVPIRFVGSAGKKGTISGEFFAIGPDGERIERGFNPDDPQTPVLLVRGQFRWD